VVLPLLFFSEDAAQRPLLWPDLGEGRNGGEEGGKMRDSSIASDMGRKEGREGGREGGREEGRARVYLKEAELAAFL